MNSIDDDRAGIVEALVGIASSIQRIPKQNKPNVTKVQKPHEIDQENEEDELINDDETRANNEYEVYEALDDKDNESSNEDYTTNHLIDPLIECKYDLQAELKVNKSYFLKLL